MSILVSLLEDLEKRRERNVLGEFNCIPSPFLRFSTDFVGIEREKYYLVTGLAKSAKTQFASRVFIYEPLKQAFLNPDRIKLRIFYYPLEESPKAVFLRYISYLLYTESEGKIRLSSTDLKSTKKGNPLKAEILELLSSEVYKRQLDFFEEHVVFSEETNPTGIYKECRDWADTNGKTIRVPVEYKDSLTGEIKTKMKVDHYEPYDQDLYTIIFIDHISLISPESGMNLRESIIKLSSYLVNLRNFYGFTPVVVQQQASDVESVESIKMGRTRPTTAGLADSKYTARDCNIAFGIHNPYKYDEKSYLGYDITKFKGNIRFVEVLVNRDGESNGVCPLFFDGATCFFKELPLPNSKDIAQVYTFLDNLKSKTLMVLCRRRNRFKFLNFMRKHG